MKIRYEVREEQVADVTVYPIYRISLDDEGKELDAIPGPKYRTDKAKAEQAASILNFTGTQEEDPMFAPTDPCDCEQCWLCSLQREQAISDTADWLAEQSYTG